MRILCQKLLVVTALFAKANGLVTQRNQKQHVPPVEDADDQLRLSGHRTNFSKMMFVKGHKVSEVSVRWTGNVVYAIFTSAIEKYHDKLVAQLETWAEVPAKEGRYVAVGGNNYPEEWQSGNVVLRSECGDTMASISCKEATLLAEGAARGADWLVVVGEDNYVHTGHMEEALKNKDPSEPVAFGVVGCGRGLYCHDNADFNAFGGLCGGGGYVISNAALRRLLENGALDLHHAYDNTRDPNDMTTSCQLRKHGVQLRYIDGLNGSPMFSIQVHLAMAHSDFLTAHYLQPNTLRWMHAQVLGKDEAEQERLEDLAFDHGCARGMNNTFWYRYVNQCMEKNSHFYQD